MLGFVAMSFRANNATESHPPDHGVCATADERCGGGGGR